MIKLIGWFQFWTSLINTIILGCCFCLFYKCVSLSACFRPVHTNHLGIISGYDTVGLNGAQDSAFPGNSQVMMLARSSGQHGPRGQELPLSVIGWCSKNKWKFTEDDNQMTRNLLSIHHFHPGALVFFSRIHLLQWWSWTFLGLLFLIFPS